MVAHSAPASVLPVLALAFLPTVILLVFWSGLRWRRAHRRRQAGELMARAAERFACGENTAALRINARVLALDPACVQALILRGIVRTEAGRYCEAVGDFDQASVLLP